MKTIGNKMNEIIEHDVNTILNSSVPWKKLEGKTILITGGSGKQPYEVDVGDIDGDGDLDIVEADQSNKIYWYENDGLGEFNEHIVSNVNGPYHTYSADLDGDGDMDILSSIVQENKVVWYSIEGDGSFTESIISNNALGARGVYTADIDNDGDIDVLSASNGDDKIAWYENDGEQNFTEHVISFNFENIFFGTRKLFVIISKSLSDISES